MAMVLQPSRIRLTQAIYFGKPAGFGVTSITDGNGTLATPNPIITVGSIALGTLTSDHNFGGYNIFSKNSQNVFNVKAYGAIGDGAADDTIAFQNAIDDAVLLGGTVYVPKSDNPYKITATLTIVSQSAAPPTTRARGVTIRGEASAYPGDGAYAVGTWRGSSLKWAGAASGKMLSFTAKDNISASQNAVIDLNLDGGGILGVVGIYCDSGNPNNQVQNKFLAEGVIGTRLNRGIQFGDFTGTGVDSQTDSTTVRRCFFTEPDDVVTSAAIFYDSSNNSNAWITDTTILGHRFGIYLKRIGYGKIGPQVSGGLSAGVLDLIYFNGQHGVIEIDQVQAEDSHAVVNIVAAANGTDYPINIHNCVLDSDVAGNNSTVLVGAASHINSWGNEYNRPIEFTAGVSVFNTVGDRYVNVGGWMPGQIITNATGTIVIGNGISTTRWGIGTPTPGTSLDLGPESDARFRITGNGTLSGFGGVEMTNVAGFGLQTASAYYGFNDSTGAVRYLTMMPGQLTGIAVTVPTRTLDVGGTQRWRGIAAPAVSEANSATMYFDSGTNTLKASLNGGAYVNVLGSGGVTGTGVFNKAAYWTSATDLTNSTDVTFGGAYPIEINGSINLANAGDHYDINGLNMLQVDQFTGRFAAGTGAGVAGLGFGSMAVGYAAGTTATGLGCTLIGTQAAQTSTGDKLTVVGDAGLLLNSTGQENVAVGFNAGGTNTTGSSNIFIGSGADASAGNLSHAIAIGANVVVGASNSLILGDGSNKVGIRTTTPAAPLDVNGAVATRHKDIALVNGLNSDIALTDASLIRITGPVGAFSIGGFTNGVDGRILRVINTTANAMTIVNLDGASAAANQITTLTGADVVLAARTSAATFIYEDVSDTWILMSYN
jgi:hypothetical protein